MSPFRVLILDFDVFTTIGGGQVFYRRVVEQNPEMEFFYPSRGSDIVAQRAGHLPPNARPLACQALDGGWRVWPGDQWGHWTTTHYSKLIASVASAVQGEWFDVVDVPSFLPAVDLVRPLFSAYGVKIERVALSFLGWLSASSRNAYAAESDASVISALEAAEVRSVNAADIRYTISDIELHQDWRTTLPIGEVDMHDTLEKFAPPTPAPPGEGLPDLWYVGRLDRAKGPDLFVEMVARVPRGLYRNCFITGPDNEWSTGTRWSDHILSLARSHDIEIDYVGQLSDAELRSRVYAGRCVVVIPSRTDTFNYVALEATLSGCPIVLSERAGASVFLRDHHPDICPPIMGPDRLEEAAGQLRDLLEHYPQRAATLRARLLENPFPAPRSGFMADIYGLPRSATAAARAAATMEAATISSHIPLLAPLGEAWRPIRRDGEPRVSIVIPTFDRPELLAPTLASLMRQTYKPMEVVVVDDGSPRAELVRQLVTSFGPSVRLIRTSNQGEAAAVNHGISAARGEFIGILSDDDIYHPELIAESVAALDRDPNAIGTYVDWDIVDHAGYFVEAHRLPDFDRRLMLCAHWCLPGVGTLVRKRVLEVIGGRDTSFRWVSDFDLWLRATACGDLIHIPRTLAYWRLHGNNLTTSSRRELMADERLRLIGQFLAAPQETHWTGEDRATAMAAAHLCAAAILGQEATEAAKSHMIQSLRLAPDLLSNLPPNMANYPDIWAEGVTRLFNEALASGSSRPVTSPADV